MKKSLILLSTVALLAACSEYESALPVIETDGNAISFSAYAGESTTKGVVESNTAITEAGGYGIGVFAFYQPAVAGVSVDFNTRKFAIPDFMYNQKVSCATTANKWEYDPVKFWPNNTGDQLSFFAYAPYKEGTTWDDLGIATDATASKITASFPIYNEKNAMKDILWTDPQLNKTKASTTVGATNNPIIFNFRHLLSKVAIYAGVEQNTATGAPTKWNDENTEITIDKIEFTNLADAYNYTCTIPMNPTNACWKASTTTQDIVLTYSNGDFEDTSAVINTNNYDTAAFKDLLSKESSQNAFLFLAPQSFTDGNEQAIITYTVKTTATGDKSNSSTITNTIATDLYDILSAADNAFTTGKAYTLKFLIGMNSVKITAIVTDWAEATEHQIDVPANDGPKVYVTGSNCSISNYNEDANYVYFTVSTSQYFSKLEFGESADGSSYTINSNLTLSGINTNSEVVKIAKTSLTSGKKLMKVTATNAITLSNDCVNCSASFSSETDDAFTFSIVQNQEQEAYKSFSVFKYDGSSWSNNVLQATEEDGKCTINGSSITYKKSSTSIDSIKVKANGTLENYKLVNCSISTEPVQDADVYIITVTRDSGKDNIIVKAKEQSGDYVTLSSGTGEGEYEATVNNSTTTIKYHKRTNESYNTIRIVAQE